MKNIFGRTLSLPLCVLLIATLGTPCLSAASAVDDAPENVWFLAGGEMLADGSWTREYWVDAHGNRVEEPTSQTTAQAPVRAVSLPRRFDLREYGCITPVKNQAGAGACWAFAAITAMESNYILRGYGTRDDTDFSEAHLVWFGHRQRTSDPSDPTHGDGNYIENPFTIGGYWHESGSTFMRGSGPQLEQNAPWIEAYNETTMMQMEQPESDRYASYARTLSVTCIPNDSPSLVKQKILENGAVTVSYYEDFSSHCNSPNGNSYYQNAATNHNHAVAVVGWDDDFAVTNFSSANRPPSPGAWLIKGSYGELWAGTGYYWISYCDPSVSGFVTYTTAPLSTFDHIYQYDGARPVGSAVSLFSGTIANIFTAQRDEWLTHVAFYSPNNTPVNATAEVYLAPDDYQLSGADPTTGMTRIADATASACDVECGYTTIELAQPIFLSAGQTFTVAITLERDDNFVLLPFEGEKSSNPYESTVVFDGEEGTSFLYANGVWEDTNNYQNKYDYNNVPVKAMTRDVKPDAHAFDEPEWSWSADHSSAAAVFTCADCGNVLRVPAAIRTNTISELSCTTDSVVTYTASVKYGGVTYTGTTDPVTLAEAPGHDYDAVVTEATCLSGGNTTYTCTRCGDRYTVGETAALGHDYRAVVKEPTCTAGGYTTYTCARCGDKYTGGETDALGHDYAAVVKEPTCTAGGSTTYTCTRCGNKYTGDQTDALGHDYSVVYRVAEPTCYNQGYTVYKCSRCSKTESRDFADALGHDYQVYQTVDATCVEGGCTVYKCLRCGRTESRDFSEPLDHDFSVVLNVVEATCFTAGYTVYRCARCEETDTVRTSDALGHDYEQAVVTVEPTCDGNGEIVYTCSRCGETTGETTAALGHDYAADVTEPTCISGGYTLYTCKRCGVSFYADDTGSLGHDYDAAVTEPTCAAVGYTTYTCRRCGDSYISDKTAALGHDFGEWTWVKPLSAEGPNTRARTCARCGEQETGESSLPGDTLMPEIADVRAVNRTGQTVRVPVWVRQNPGVISAGFRLEYDQTRLRLSYAENGEVFPDDSAAFGGDLSAVPYTLLWNGADPNTDSTAVGTLVTLVFDVLPGAENGTIPIRLSSIPEETKNAATQTVPVCVLCGSVKLADRVAGDANNDGALDLLDVAVYSRCLAGGWNVSIDADSADVNGDGKFNLKDVVLIRRFLAGGWDVVLI